MSGNLSVLEVYCDAPAYAVVRACEGLGLRDPLDVRWLRLDHLPGDARKSSSVLDLDWWLHLVGVAGRRRTCSCGKAFPTLHQYHIALSAGRKRVSLLGQCSCCHTIYWDES